MKGLTYQLQRYIVKQLACDVPPETVAETLREEFLQDANADVIAQYDPGAEGESVTEELRKLYEQTREAYGVGTEDERSFVAVATTDAFADRTTYCVDEHGKQIALIAHDGAYYALANRCTHQGGPLCEGTVEDGAIACPWHGARFEVDTGKAVASPAPTGVEQYDVRVRGDTIEVRL